KISPPPGLLDSTNEDERNSIKVSSQPAPETPAIRQNGNTTNATVLEQRSLTTITRQFIDELKRRNVRTRNLISFWRIDSTKKYLFVYGDNREAFSQLLMNETYPRSINSQQFNIEQPKHIPPQMSVLAMGVSCQLSEAEVIADVQEQYASADVVLFVCPASSRTQNVKQQLSEINKAHVDTMLNLSNQINMLSAKVDRVSSKVEQMNHLVSKVVIPCVFTLADSLVKLDEKISCMEGSVSIQVTACYAPRSSDLPLSSLRSVCSNTACQLLGDFNAYSDLWGCTSTDNRGRQLEQFIEELNLNVSATEATSKRATTSTNVIDLT
ncbi:unnamed protein product, partial [Didymodactylos carnosus]